MPSQWYNSRTVLIWERVTQPHQWHFISFITWIFKVKQRFALTEEIAWNPFHPLDGQAVDLSSVTVKTLIRRLRETD